MGEHNGAHLERHEASQGTILADRAGDNLQQFRLSDKGNNYPSGAPGASDSDRLPPLSIDSVKGAEGLGNPPPISNECQSSLESGFFPREEDPKCKVSPILDESKAEAKPDPVREQIKQGNEAGSESKVDPIRQQIKEENEPGAAKVDPVKEQMMKDSQPGKRASYDDNGYQSRGDNQQGAAEYYRAMSSASRVITGGSSW